MNWDSLPVSSRILDKHFSMLCVGKSYFSFLLLFSLLKRGQKVLLLDDQSLSFGEQFVHAPRQIELDFLRRFGLEEDIQVLAEIEKYSKKEAFFVHLDQERLLLGQSPAENLRELMRTMPDLFVAPQLDLKWLASPVACGEFNELYFSTVSRLAASAYQFQGVQELNYELFLTQCPQSLRELFEVFSAHLMNSTQSRHQLFLYIFRSLYHHQTTVQVSRLECFHLFISLLSPQYHLDSKQLLQELLKTYLERGGQYKSTHVREWRFDAHRPWSVELASFDGIVHPQKISFHGNLPQPHPFEISPLPESYRGVRIRWSLNEQWPKSLTNCQILSVKLNQIGTDFPWWRAHFKENEVEFLLPMGRQRGVKLEFMRHTLRQFLRRELSLLAYIPTAQMVEESMELTSDLWMKPFAIGQSMTQGIYDTSAIGKRDKLKNVSYFGPLKECPLGLFSALMDLRQGQQYL